MRAFLGDRGVVDHQHGIAAADQLVRLNQQFRLHRPGIPDPGRDKVVQLIVLTRRNPLTHRLNALAVARPNQPRYVERAHLSPCFVTQPIQKRLQPTSKIASPIRCPANHGRPLQKPTSHVSQKTCLGIPRQSKSAKVVLRPRFFGLHLFSSQITRKPLARYSAMEGTLARGLLRPSPTGVTNGRRSGGKFGSRLTFMTFP